MSTQEDYQHQLMQLRPRGWAWPESKESTQGKLLGDVAEEFARVDARIWDLLREADPRTVNELLAEWEYDWGLPEPCVVAPSTVRSRVLVLFEKVTRVGGQSKPYFIALAARLGYNITIERCSMRQHGARMGTSYGGVDWQYVWDVHLPLTNYQHRRSGSGHGEPYATWGAELLECVLYKLKPAESVLRFIYS